MTPAGVPSLDSLAGQWLDRSDLAHLPSLRNQWGQAHANEDLTSLSWLAIPPFSGGYHTGVLRVDGAVPAAQRLRWFPWGVQREGTADGLRVSTDTRLGYESNDVRWRVELSNPGPTELTAVVEHELIAPVAHSEVDWGWLYGTPWSAGHHHDYFTTERIRAGVLAETPRQVHLVAPGPRYIRLGRPRNPGIQRDETQSDGDTSAMLLSSELPDHSTPDAGRVRAPAARATVRAVGARTPAGEYAVGAEREYALDHDEAEVRLDAVDLPDGAVLRAEVRLDRPATSGVVLTHGNHPDSVQLGFDAGRPWLRVAGEHVVAADAVPAGSWHELAVTVSRDGAVLAVDGHPVAATDPWWGRQRWRADEDGGVVRVSDGRSPARCAFAFAVAPDEVHVDGARAFARWRVRVGPGQTVRLGTVLCLGTDHSGVARRATTLAEDFDAQFDTVADRWRETWAAAFTPGNAEFSGHLPTLFTLDDGLARTYYLGALLAVYLRNTGVSRLGPVFLTGGPRLGPTTTFYWDQSEWARTAALLEPVGLRAWILAALAQPYDRSHSFDTRNLLPVGNHYAANDHALFRTVQAYIGVTGDLGLLDEVAAGRTGWTTCARWPTVRARGGPRSVSGSWSTSAATRGNCSSACRTTATPSCPSTPGMSACCATSPISCAGSATATRQAPPMWTPMSWRRRCSASTPATAGGASPTPRGTRRSGTVSTSPS